MPDRDAPDDAPDDRVGPIDHDVLDRIARRLDSSARFSTVDARPAYAPNSVVADYDLGYLPNAVDRAYLRIRWFETDDFHVHYAEQYDDGSSWECRWDRHPNEHSTRDHFHPPPEAATPGVDEDFPRDWRDVLSRGLGELDDRLMAFWD